MLVVVLQGCQADQCSKPHQCQQVILVAVRTFNHHFDTTERGVSNKETWVYSAAVFEMTKPDTVVQNIIFS